MTENWAWAVAQPLNTHVRRAAWAAGEYIYQYKAGKWRTQAGPYIPGVSNPPDQTATDWGAA